MSKLDGIFVVAIDPSIVSPGIAIVQKDKLVEGVTLKVLGPSFQLSFRLNNLAEQLVSFIKPFQKGTPLIAWHGIVEVAESFEYVRTRGRGGSTRHNQKDLHKLQQATGVCIRALGECGILAEAVTPDQWKQNTPKEIIIQRVNDVHGLALKKRDNNTADAIGLADWYMQRLKFESCKSKK